MSQTILKKSQLILGFVITFTFIVTGCKKNYDFQPTPKKNIPTTVIGSEAVNPFSFSTVKKALEILRNKKRETGVTTMSENQTMRSLEDITPSHKYVRFAPVDVEQLTQLLDAGLELFDVPLMSEIIQEGEFYQDPSIPSDQITYQYTLFPYDYTLPGNIPYVILDEIFLFNETPGEYQQPDYWSGSNGNSTGIESQQTQQVNNLTSLNTIEDFVLRNGDPVIEATDYLLNNQFNPTEVYNTVMELLGERDLITVRWYDTGGGGSGGGGSGNLNTLPGIPSGRLLVRNTEMPIDEPVKGVTVKARRFLKLEIKQTDRNGRFQMTKQFRNKATIIVKFKNKLITTRGINGLLKVWQYAFPIKQNLGQWNNDNMNRIEHVFITDRNENSQATRAWTGATTMNAHWDTDEFNRENGIVSPPHLKVWISDAVTKNASAPMLNYVLNPLTGAPEIVNAYNIVSSKIDALLTGIPFVGEPLKIIKRILQANLPDVTLRYGTDPNVWNLNSNEFYSTFIHEFSHSAHCYGLFLENGRDGMRYWAKNIGYVVINNGYGQRQSEGAERTGIIESWGYFAEGHGFARKYRTGVYVGVRRAEDEANRAIAALENQVADNTWALELGNPGTDDNFLIGWIPAGLLHDLNDGGTESAISRNINGNFLIDNVSGYSINRIFNILQTTNNTAADLRVSMLNNRPPGVLINQVESLFPQYGW
ncbi:MAG: hypothetical protein IM552_05445 [Chitinophagaceae bacterium]|nr:hypothetical protein [Chitinophagaceae bacterium]